MDMETLYVRINPIDIGLGTAPVDETFWYDVLHEWLRRKDANDPPNRPTFELAREYKGTIKIEDGHVTFQAPKVSTKKSVGLFIAALNNFIANRSPLSNYISNKYHYEDVVQQQERKEVEKDRITVAEILLSRFMAWGKPTAGVADPVSPIDIWKIGENEPLHVPPERYVPPGTYINQMPTPTPVTEAEGSYTEEAAEQAMGRFDRSASRSRPIPLNRDIPSNWDPTLEEAQQLCNAFRQADEEAWNDLTVYKPGDLLRYGDGSVRPVRSAEPDPIGRAITEVRKPGPTVVSFNGVDVTGFVKNFEVREDPKWHYQRTITVEIIVPKEPLPKPEPTEEAIYTQLVRVGVGDENARRLAAEALKAKFEESDPSRLDINSYVEWTKKQMGIALGVPAELLGSVGAYNEATVVRELKKVKQEVDILLKEMHTYSHTAHHNIPPPIPVPIPIPSTPTKAPCEKCGTAGITSECSLCPNCGLNLNT